MAFAFRKGRTSRCGLNRLVGIGAVIGREEISARLQIRVSSVATITSERALAAAAFDDVLNDGLPANERKWFVPDKRVEA